MIIFLLYSVAAAAGAGIGGSAGRSDEMVTVSNLVAQLPWAILSGCHKYNKRQAAHATPSPTTKNKYKSVREKVFLRFLHLHLS